MIESIFGGYDEMKLIACGWVLGLISREIVKFWQAWRERIRAGLKDIDNQIEEKTGKDIPDAWQERYERMVDSAISYADRFASDGAFWRNVIRAIMNKDASKIPDLLGELKKIDWTKYLYDQLSPELKEIVNTEKKQIAAQIVANKTAMQDSIQRGDLNAAIDHAAKADKSEKLRVSEPVNETVIARLIRESQERQEALRSKLN